MSGAAARPRVDRGGRYEFHLAEAMTPTAVAAFPGLSETQTTDGTVLHGRVRGQTELHWILDRFALMGVTILEVRRLPD